MAAKIMAEYIFVLGLCLHTGIFAQIPPEVLRTLADHSDRMYYMEKTVKQLQSHVTELTNKLDGMVAQKDNTTSHIKLHDSSNTVCCDCCSSTNTPPVPVTAQTPTTTRTTIQTAVPTPSSIAPRVSTGTVAPTVAPTRIPVTIQATPTCGWTPWINRDTPSDGLENEHLTTSELIQFCPNGNVTSLTCATGSGIPAYFTKEVFTCSLATGLVCKNTDNAQNPCSDYKVRYYCDCGTDATPTSVPAVTPSDDIQSTQPNCNTSYWTPWINRSKPRYNMENIFTATYVANDTEHEQLSSAELAQYCNNGSVDRIECETVDGISFYSTGDIVAACDLKRGLVCNTDDNWPIPCNDYRVRYGCHKCM